MDILLKVVDENRFYKKPEYANEYASGADLYASLDTDNIELKPKEVLLVGTNVSVELPEGYEFQVRSKSGIAYKNSVFVLNSPGTIDSDYRGEIKVILYNLGSEPFIIENGMKIAQLVLSKTNQVNFTLTNNLTETERGVGGFGSTGLK